MLLVEDFRDLLREVLTLVEGELIFYKTVNNCLWYPRHIQAHVESFNKDVGTKVGVIACRK